MAAETGVRSLHAELTAATEDTATLSGADKVGMRADLVHHGYLLDGTTAATEPIYFRLDGTAAVAQADETEVLLSGERISVQLPESGQVSLISAGTPGYSLVLTD